MLLQLSSEILTDLFIVLGELAKSNMVDLEKIRQNFFEKNLTSKTLADANL